ncbi:chloride channel activity protein [Halocaridina rubra]|uniref:Bestrophin homolog n=1 Tax=Halocaridina rubra TaxID=373956 RepID=A0AAN8ZSV4_HALRR
MTVSYQYDVASSTSGGFTRLLFKWRGSLYKLIYRELFIFCVGYGAMSVIYRYVFNEEQKSHIHNVEGRLEATANSSRTMNTSSAMQD